jgi:hypothetical protein
MPSSSLSVRETRGLLYWLQESPRFARGLGFREGPLSADLSLAKPRLSHCFTAKSMRTAHMRSR